MWFPGKKISEDIRDLFITALNDEEVKKEFAKRFDENMEQEKHKNKTEHLSRTQSGTSRNRYSKNMQSYDELTSGNVNLQARMAASGYDVYGRTILTGHQSTTHDNMYRKMKNKIQYGKKPQEGYRNRGDNAKV